MPNHHLSKQYDLELDAIRTQVLQMGALVEGQCRMAIDSFWTGNLSQAHDVINGDKRVNSLEVHLDDACNHVIVRRQPTANDLRLIMATLKVITDLERIGDEATKIARNAINLTKRLYLVADLKSDLEMLSEDVVAMLQESVETFACMDSGRATALITRDQRIDNEFRSVMLRLITAMSDDPRSISPRLDILWIAKALERIGDHSKNIAEYVIFVASGQDIRHMNDQADAMPELGVPRT
ncbi:phosphate signaling complex protein PhoU [Massilia timonae]|uniref:phosphate signaling complex protein PhoU n=1 Tax=Massilia timonae TaxID=47229 RepID=UPI0028D560F0|nr:phosphate signaling complex protein PhoU [Massilia timonae]